MKNRFHDEILKLIRKNSGKPIRDPFLNSYMGNDHIRYPIDTPSLRAIAKNWMRAHKDLLPHSLADVLTSLIQGESSTEKIIAGIMLGYATPAQRKFDPIIFDRWLDHLAGWTEVDAVCTGDFPAKQLPTEWSKWKKLLTKLSKDSNINKRRASLVLLCSPLTRAKHDDLVEVAFQNIGRLKSEKQVLITKAISWVLRSMIKHHRERVADYLQSHAESLPKIAVRETRTKLATGRKTMLAIGEFSS